MIIRLHPVALLNAVAHASNVYYRQPGGSHRLLGVDVVQDSRLVIDDVWIEEIELRDQYRALSLWRMFMDMRLRPELKTHFEPLMKEILDAQAHYSHRQEPD